ncbi:MAG: RdgB/HAM1 family non-canonical purine NTP pyrophosphatase [Lachnospiraceae bacterium]|nr:RdgB/HAM1 family non-canonical purine NTP pyrophosphatase [Lachnospiraceae bacterium]
MKTIVFATGNKDKVVEIREILGDLDVDLKTMKEVGFTEDIEENGTTFRENAAIKAEAVAAYLRKNVPEYADAIVMADDSGLEIDAMGKMPGVMSHRWLGDRTYPQAMQDIIDELKDVPEEKRSARFVCSIAACVPGKETLTVQETIEGRVAHEIRGTEGFGYDPFFYVPEFGCTTAEMSREQKNAISHRGKGIRAMRDLLLKEGVLG